MTRDALTLGVLRNQISTALGRHDLGAARAALVQLRALYAAAQGPPPAMAAAFAELGDFSSLADDYPAAVAAYDRAIALQPGESRYWFNRAAVRRFLGELERAEQDYDQALSLDPADAQAWLNRSDLRVQSRERNHLQALEAARASGSQDWRFQVPILHALAKEYEDVGEFARSWSHLHAGARLRRQYLQYDPQTDLDTVEWLIEAFAQPLPVSRQRSAPDPQPVFIVGMPRTGSTLVDRILGNHSAVYSAGELTEFGQTVVAHSRARLQRTPSAPPHPGRKDLVLAAADVDFAALGAEYLRRVQPRLPLRSVPLRHFTDKLPLNYLYCGLIARALPAAQIVHVTRHPMAVCYAMYKMLFDQGYPFSYDLGEIADYYIAYRRLMDHWERTLPGRIHCIAYEDLVQDPESHARALLAAVALPWEAGCLQSHQNRNPVATASAAQVRRPIYASSVALWRNYESQLAPVRARLLAAGVPCSP